MAQLTMKELSARLDAWENKDRQYHGDDPDVYERLTAIEADIVTLGNGFVEVDKLIAELRASDNINDELPPWAFEVIRAVIEALYGVRLQRAQEFALALEAKYFPGEEVVLTRPV